MNKKLKIKNNASSLLPSEWIKNNLSKSNYELNLLDLACGNGRNSMYAASIGYKVTSVDINKNTLSEMQNNEFIMPIQLDLEKNNIWALQDKKFDVVLMSYLYNGVPGKEIPKLANKAFNIINSGGIYIVHDFMVEDDRNGPHLAALWQLQHLAFTPTAKSITPSWVSKVMKDSGFYKIVNNELIPGMTKIVYGKKPID